jgi:hypothetical protein
MDISYKHCHLGYLISAFDGNELAKMLDLMDRVEGETCSEYSRPKNNCSSSSIDKMHA